MLKEELQAESQDSRSQIIGTSEGHSDLPDLSSYKGYRLVRLSSSLRQLFLPYIKETFFASYSDPEKHYTNFLRLLLQDMINAFAFVHDGKLLCMLLIYNSVHPIERQKFLVILGAKSYNTMRKKDVLELKESLLFLCEQVGSHHIQMRFNKDRTGFAKMIGMEPVITWRLSDGRQF